MSHDSYSSGWRLHCCSQTPSLRSSWSGSYASWKLHWHSACLRKSSVVVVFHIRRSLGCDVTNLHMCRHQHTHSAPEHECAEPLPLAARRNRHSGAPGSGGAPGNMHRTCVQPYSQCNHVTCISDEAAAAPAAAAAMSCRSDTQYQLETDLMH